MKWFCGQTQFIFRFVVVVQLLSDVWLFATPWTAACQASLFFTISWSLLKLMPIDSMMPSNHLILCHPLLLLSSIFPSIRVLSNDSALQVKWPKYWSFNFSISPSSEYSGLISFRIDLCDLLAVQGDFRFSVEVSKKSVIAKLLHVMKSLSRVRLFVTPWTVAHQAPPPMEFSRQEYWSGLPFPSPKMFLS